MRIALTEYWTDFYMGTCLEEYDTFNIDKRELKAVYDKCWEMTESDVLRKKQGICLIENVSSFV